MKENIKKNIEVKLNSGDLENVFEFFDAYEKTCPCDRDLWFYQCVGYMMVGELDKAQGIAERCVRKFPTSYEAYYYLGSVHQAKGNTIEAIKSYKISQFLSKHLHVGQEDIIKDIDSQIEQLLSLFEEEIQLYERSKDIEKLLRISSFLKREDVMWGKYEKAPRSIEKLLVGKEYWVTDDELRYVGV